MATDPRHMPYARETAMCVDFAYNAMEDDIRAELDRPGGPSADALTRVLEKLHARRDALKEFTNIVRAA